MLLNLETTLLPLSLLILLGWVLGRWQNVDLKSVATILVYGIAPIVAFGSTAQLSFHGSLVLLPAMTFALASANGLACFALGRRLLRKKDLAYLLPVATGSGNNGYFGLPLAMAIFAPDQVGVYFLITLGVTLFEATLGYYFVGRGHLTVQQALKRVRGMPVTYAIAAGLVFSALHFTLDPGVLKLWDIARGCYVGFGMMIIGFALAMHKRLSWDADLIALTLLGKYVFWALLGFGFIWVDMHLLHLFDGAIHAMVLILALTPVAANTAAFAAQHDFRPQAAATIVFLTTIISFAALPAVLPLVEAFAR